MFRVRKAPQDLLEAHLHYKLATALISAAQYELTSEPTKRIKRHVRDLALLMKCTVNKTQHSRQFGDNCLYMRQKRHSSIHTHSKNFDLINSFEHRPINRINELNGPHIVEEGYRFALQKF
jgi:hypothetical protein